ncbi:MAG: T9SS type A sorting domain-containing protein [Ignavibacteriaceae bacterium]|nr:T9SS type A sorting domain-containing protein [Ignavibacteriaceae bacterium]
MKKTLISVTMAAIFLSFTLIMGARDWRVSQIPNGSKFNCQNCHISSLGGGTRNGFGIEVWNNFLDPFQNEGGNVVWGSALAALDSDGDGFSNGVELQDPNGDWRPGQPQPGVLSEVTNPGDPNSKPSPNSIDDFTGSPESIKLFDNYPNPFNPSTKIRYYIPEASDVRLEIYNQSGELLYSLVEGFQNQGAYEVVFTAANLSSGVYFYILNTGAFSEIKKMILLK